MDPGRRPHSHQCCCHVVASGSKEFQKILESEDAGIVIYRYVPQADGAILIRERKAGEAFIIRNTQKAIATSDNLTAAFEQKRKLTCPRCIKILEHVQGMVGQIKLIDSRDIVSICDNCRRKERPLTSCLCTEIINKFLNGSQSDERESRTQRIKIWLKRVQHLLHSAETCEIGKNKRKTCVRSELSFDDVVSDFIKSERRDTRNTVERQPTHRLGASLDSLQTQTEQVRLNVIEPIESAHAKTSGKKHSSSLPENMYIDSQEFFKHLPSFGNQVADKSVHMSTKMKPKSINYICLNESMSISSLPQKFTVKTETKLNAILKSQKHIRSRLQREDSLAPERKRQRSLSPPSIPWIHYSQKQIFKAASEQDIPKLPRDFTFSFPKEIRKEVQRYVSSSELIKTTQDILNENEKRKKEEELKRKYEEDERIKRANEEREEKKKIKFQVEKQAFTDIGTAISKQKSKQVEPTKIHETIKTSKAEDKEAMPKQTEMNKKSEKADIAAKQIEERYRSNREKQEKAPPLKDKEDKVEKQKESKLQSVKEEKPQPPTKIDNAGDLFNSMQAQKEKEKLEREKKEKEQQKETEFATKKMTAVEKAAKDERAQVVPSKKIPLKDITEKLTPEVTQSKKFYGTVKEEKKKDTAASDSLKAMQAQKEKERLEQKNITKEQQNEIEQAQKKATEAEKVAKDSAKEKAVVKLKEMKTEKPVPEVPKSPPRKPEKPTTKELSLKQVKLKTSSDDLILKLVKMKQTENMDRERKKEKNDERNIRSTSMRYQRVKHSPICGDGDLDFNEVVESIQPDELHEIIIGNKLFKHNGPLNIPQECEPIPIVEMKELEKMDDTNSVERTAQTKTPPEVLTPTKTAKTKIQVAEGESVGKGVIRYALSDRAFIDKGWTLLPTEKMNVYRMRPAHPEFDWFEHNKNKRVMQYDSGEKLAEFDDDGRGRWYYRSGMLALDYYNAEEINAQQRFVVYSSGEPDERGRTRPRTILATFDYLGNGVVFDHTGKIRLKYNQTEGVVLDRSIGPVSHWKWHTLNDPPVLQQVMIDTQMPYKDANIAKLGGSGSDKIRADNEEMLAIEFDNFIKEKSRKLTQKFKPFQIKMKALKINEYFSLRVLDQATVYLLFRDGTTNLKINIGMVLDHKEIVDTDTAEVGEVSSSLDRLPARTDSLAELQRAVTQAQHLERLRVRHERRLIKPPEPCGSADQLRAGISRPLRHMLITDSSTGVPTQCQCRKPSSSNLYYDTRI